MSCNWDSEARLYTGNNLLIYLAFHRFVFRENRVPYYQRLFQQHDGKRQWWKTERSGYLMWPYLISVYGMGIGRLFKYTMTMDHG
ncbi:hypothetical protein RIB2604_02006590 [Aspergillus luchuensis]|uniref:Uncharacterized protein n=1 Tax=Aspergillus kawachii TaxID=1069201 RepID=A0A146FJD7_ASPKA|nr:hypothetical protein RIB2604_02006590 [Aspergillus luchuensis]